MKKNFFWDIGESPPNIPEKYYYSLGAASHNPQQINGLMQTIKQSFMPHIPFIIGSGLIGFFIGWKAHKFWEGPAF